MLAWFPKAFTQGCTIECKSLAENGHLIRKYDVTYFMASVDSLEGEKGNAAFAASTRPTSRCLSDPTKETAEGLRRAERARLRQSLDVLHRQGRHDSGDRQGPCDASATSAQDMAAKLGELKVATK